MRFARTKHRLAVITVITTGTTCDELFVRWYDSFLYEEFVRLGASRLPTACHNTLGICCMLRFLKYLLTIDEISPGGGGLSHRNSEPSIRDAPIRKLVGDI